MGRVAVDIKRRRKAAGLFSTENVNLKRREWKRLSEGRMSTSRFIFSWMALFAGLASCYTAMHYAPSLIGKNDLLAISTRDAASGKLDVSNENVLAPYLKLFDLRRAYMRKGQTIIAQYENPRGMDVDLHITKCRQAPVIEVFNCEPVGQQVVTIRDKSGAREFRVADSGFYYFNEAVRRGEDDGDYRIVWRRG